MSSAGAEIYIRIYSDIEAPFHVTDDDNARSAMFYDSSRASWATAMLYICIQYILYPIAYIYTVCDVCTYS